MRPAKRGITVLGRVNADPAIITKRSISFLSSIFYASGITSAICARHSPVQTFPVIPALQLGSKYLAPRATYLYNSKTWIQ